MYSTQTLQITHHSTPAQRQERKLFAGYKYSEMDTIDMAATKAKDAGISTFNMNFPTGIGATRRVSNNRKGKQAALQTIAAKKTELGEQPSLNST